MGWVVEAGRRLRRVGSELGCALAPARCQVCTAETGRASWSPFLCRRCGDRLRPEDAPVPAPRPLASAHGHLRLQGPARFLVHALKYEGEVRVGRILGRRMAEARRGRWLARRSGLVVPVPLHWRRRWRRGHNQAAVLARSLAETADLPYVAALRRATATRPQVGLGRRARRRNVAGAFRLRSRRRGALNGEAVLLVDDVVTTGATAAAAAVALRGAGVRSVRLYAAAWAPAVR